MTVAKIMRAIGRAVPVLLCDFAGLAGAGLMAYGAWLIQPALGFILGGLLLLVGAASIARSRR